MILEISIYGLRQVQGYLYEHVEHTLNDVSDKEPHDQIQVGQGEGVAEEAWEGGGGGWCLWCFGQVGI